ncbi:PREDICTED: uncharacterized protein K02A2.6-like [Rhagoletis zephyria]|uniref:uncharacterized protein K02A2.6-like n=1 Tax=Rhagoletis zephyria TaxID=28612 RepID=UPI0008118B5D|nr:PREDICTED: uncharacterized protein K02A2.6-like [Rhagoletis zephyria]
MDEGVKKLISQMKEQHVRDTQLMQDLIKQLVPQRISQPEEKGQEFTIEALSSSITEFCFDPESNLTFDMWYARYEDLFTVDAAKLDDAAKVRLLLRKLNTVVHNKYINYILPKHPRDLTFKETVEKLKQLFGLQTSLFNIRFNCLQLTKPHTTDFVTYAGTVNRHCENFKLKELTLDQFKCLVFVMGLKSEGDFDIRTKMLSKLDTDTALTLDGLSKECQRLINLKTDTKLIENPKNEVVVKRLHTGNAKAKQVPKTPCWFCGGMHYSRECSYSKHKCEQCKETGHKEGYCHSKKSVQRKKQKHNNKFKASRPQSKSICVVNRINTSLRKFVNISINNTKLTLQLDTASDITIISEQNYKKINTSNGVEVKDTARSATRKLPLTLQFQCKVTFKQQELELTCFVTPVRDLNVLGLDWITALGLENMSINAICNHVKAEPLGSEVTNTNKNILLLKQSFPDVFEEKLGLCKHAKAHLVVEPGRSPIFRPKRPVAYAIQHLVEEELQRLQDINVISPVSHSEWAAPIVVTKKSNGSIRICADFSTGLNAALEAYQYPLPLPEDIFSKLANAKFFSHIDLSDAFLQIEVDDKSKELLTINTHLGLFRYNRMIFGIKTFPAIFQQVMDKMLSGLDCAAAYIDDIFVSGRNELEHDRNLREVLRRIQDYGFKIKFAKCKFAVTEVKYLGYIISPDGLRPYPERVSAIKDMPEPTNVTELRSFLGAINFYGKFINKMRQLRGPLDELLKANVKWQWTSIQRNCFNSLKDILSSNLLLTHYDPNKEIIVAADASNYGLGACILHEGPDGSIKAVCHASRSLTPAEKGYSQIEKEGLALVFAVTKFHKMIFGRRFKLHTDHKPLLTIFGKKTGISAHQANRLQRWALQLLAYDFEISFISTNSFGYADVLSRLINKSNKASEDYVIASVKFEGEIKKILSDAIDKLPVTHSMIKYETEKDKTLKQLLDYIEHGWADNADIGVELKQFRLRSDNLSIIDGCIMLGQRVVIPAILRKRILKQIHKGHPGMERTKAIARSYVIGHT